MPEKKVTLSKSERDARLLVANAALPLFTSRETVIIYDGRFKVSWDGYHGQGRLTKSWVCRGQDFYPVWHKTWAQGGTATTALAQLVRWCSGKTVLPLSTWKYWVGKGIALGKPEVVRVLAAGGYPLTVDCVLCGTTLSSGLDWWNLAGVVGPCCGSTNGCRQERKVKNHE